MQYVSLTLATRWHVITRTYIVSYDNYKRVWFWGRVQLRVGWILISIFNTRPGINWITFISYWGPRLIHEASKLFMFIHEVVWGYWWCTCHHRWYHLRALIPHYLLGTKPFTDRRKHCHLILQVIFKCILIWVSQVFIQENEFENVTCNILPVYFSRIGEKSLSEVMLTRLTGTYMQH